MDTCHFSAKKKSQDEKFASVYNALPNDCTQTCSMHIYF